MVAVLLNDPIIIQVYHQNRVMSKKELRKNPGGLRDTWAEERTKTKMPGR